jgi:hypothetical protein
MKSVTSNLTWRVADTTIWISLFSKSLVLSDRIEVAGYGRGIEMVVSTDSIYGYVCMYVLTIEL